MSRIFGSLFCTVCTNLNGLFLNITPVFEVFCHLLRRPFPIMETHPCAICKKMKGYKKVSMHKNEIFLHFYAPFCKVMPLYDGFAFRKLYKTIKLIHKICYKPTLFCKFLVTFCSCFAPRRSVKENSFSCVGYSSAIQNL